MISCVCHRIRESIEKASMSDLKDFLENIRRFSPKIGEVAMRQVLSSLLLFDRKHFIYKKFLDERATR